MKKYLLLLGLLAFFSCDDGNFIVDELNFDESSVARCTEGDLVYYMFNQERTEAIFITLASSINDTIPDQTVSLSQSTSPLEYFAFASNGSTFFCRTVPDPDVSVIQQWTGAYSGGTFRNVLTFDDGDGIISEEEDLNSDGDEDNDDTDMDGLPNYLDFDDDGDNVPTAMEFDKDNDGEADDTDNDGTPDYLDADDDGDNVPTRNETTAGTRPNNYDADDNGTPDYLELSQVTNTGVDIPANDLIHNYNRLLNNTLTFENLSLTNENGNTINVIDDSGTSFSFGTLTIVDPELNVLNN
ncbi:hypothetical protein ACFQ1M_01830 [Sungkyunkwania multivorans]|uniref:Calcium-binding protein n=1 Tax=Sungkyunkwania multivorans TaxID=1173618 RepID=A0ABW3CTD8_9FLAO